MESDGFTLVDRSLKKKKSQSKLDPKKHAANSIKSSKDKKEKKAKGKAGKGKEKGKGKGKEGLLSTQVVRVDDGDMDMEVEDATDGLLPTAAPVPVDINVDGDEDLLGDEDEGARKPLYDGPEPKKVRDAKMARKEDETEMKELGGGGGEDDDDELMIDTSGGLIPTTNGSSVPPTTASISTSSPSTTATTGLTSPALSFPALDSLSSTNSKSGGKITKNPSKLKQVKEKEITEGRKISIPPHRMTPLKKEWERVYSPLVEELGLKVRVVPNKRWVEMKTSKHTVSDQALQKACDFLNAFFLGFAVEDCMAILRMDDLYIDSFEVKDVKQILQSDHLSRAIGRIAGKDGKTKFAIENASRTRIVLADQKVHILGTFQSIKIARDAVCALILGSPPGKVYANLRNVAARAKQRG